MLQLQPLDPRVPIYQQLRSDTSPVVLVNVFQVDETDIPGLLKAWEDDANWMKRQPATFPRSCIGHRKQQSVPELCGMESVAHFRTAFSHPNLSRLSKIIHRPLSLPRICLVESLCQIYAQSNGSQTDSTNQSI